MSEYSKSHFNTLVTGKKRRVHQGPTVRVARISTHNEEYQYGSGSSLYPISYVEQQYLHKLEQVTVSSG